ncbi:MAG: SH3 domain-containing protein, partial [Chloroflexia bacterium]|nr:SH3 domain-containing protein [Chloroflexia bacterium]
MRMNLWSDTRTRLVPPPLKLLMILALVLGLIGPSAMQPVRAAGPLYPDLATTNPSSLYFSRVTMSDGVSHHVLRLSNTVWNVGEGRLELQGDPNPNGSSRIYQNIYDHPTGGSRVSQEQMNSDLLYHPSHFHYHFSNFASYQLLQRDSSGAYQSTSKDGTKTSFCIIDYARLNASGPAGERYTSCSVTLQGLSVGWGDTYLASLPEQWIDLGFAPLGNGFYAVQSTADPLRLLNEGGRVANNVATTYFSVQNGAITIGTSTSPAPTGVSGRVVNTGGSSLNCRTQPGGSIITRLAAGSTVPVTGAVQNGWYPVTCGGRAGWVSADYLQVSGTTTPSPTPTPTGMIGTVSNTGGATLNCRTQPGGTVITRLEAGTTVPVTGALQNGWYPVTCDGRSGWVSATYLKVGDGATT